MKGYMETLNFEDYLSMIGSSVPEKEDEIIKLYEVWGTDYKNYCAENGYQCIHVSYA